MQIYNIDDLEEIERPEDLISKCKELEYEIDELDSFYEAETYNKAKNQLDAFLSSISINKDVFEFLKNNSDGKAYKIEEDGYLLYSKWCGYSSNKTIFVINKQIYIGDENESIFLSLICDLRNEVGHLKERINNLRIR